MENKFADVSTECSSRHQEYSVKTSAKLFSELKLVTDNPLSISTEFASRLARLGDTIDLCSEGT